MMPSPCIKCDATRKNIYFFSKIVKTYNILINKKFVICNHRCDMCGNPNQPKAKNRSLKSHHFQKITGREHLNFKSGH